MQLGAGQGLEQQDKPLGVVREDLQILDAAPTESGAKAWLLYDPLRNSYYHLQSTTVAILYAWQAGLAESEFLQKLQQQGVEIDSQQLTGFIRFLHGHQLLKVQGPEARQQLMQMGANKQRHWLTWLVHNYLFIKIPLWRPHAFLQRTLPWVEPLFDWRLVWFVRLLGILGMLMALQQWHTFSSTFMHFFSWQGMAFYGVTLLIMKSAHELAHAYAAARRGCRVASIGVAFLVLFPMLYTDTTDAWRLKERKQRLGIVLAGINVEVHLALLATFMWSFLPDGAVRSAAFFVATTSWITSLMVNVSPFLRFDGYFALADLMGASNLQPRSFAVARWRLRELLFGWQDPIPEALTRRRQTWFVFYAWATWIYRFFLFLGIAVLVYYFAFKVLGIVLFLIEIIWFICLPVYREVIVWWERRADMKINTHTLLTFSLLAGLIGVIFVPWSSSIGVPAVLEAQDERQVFSTEDGRIDYIAIADGDKVEQGQLLLSTNSPELDMQLLATNSEIEVAKLQLARLAGDSRNREQKLILESQLKRLQSQLAGLELRLHHTLVLAPESGIVRYLEPLVAGQWVARDQGLFTVQSASALKLTGLVPEDQVDLLDMTGTAIWIANDVGLQQGLKASINEVSQVAVSDLRWSELSSELGGSIAARSVTSSGYTVQRPEDAIYEVSLTLLNESSEVTQRTLGVVHLPVEPQSYASRWYTHVMTVIIRESGF